MQITTRLQSDPNRMAALRAVFALGMPDCRLPAGFVRNMLEDVFHCYASTPLNDLDVFFYDPIDRHGVKARNVQEKLNAHHPSPIREVVNLALMHVRNGDPPYKDCADTMLFWPEIETAKGARLSSHGNLQLPAPIGIESLLAGCITLNPKRSYKLFLSCV